MTENLSLEELRAFFHHHFPLTKGVLEIQEIEAGRAIIRLDGTNPMYLRPGNTVSGPGMFTLADVGSYLAIISMVGHEGLMAVTSNCAMDFLRKPEKGNIYGHFDVLKLGRNLTVVNGLIYGANEKLVCRSNFTYAMPKD